jgi:hypothetical protein
LWVKDWLPFKAQGLQEKKYIDQPQDAAALVSMDWRNLACTGLPSVFLY